MSPRTAGKPSMKGKHELRWSNLKEMHRSPAHYKHRLDNPLVETAAMRIGSVADELVTGGAGHITGKAVVYEGVRRGKKWDEFQADNAGALIVNEREWNVGEAIARSVKACPEAIVLFNRATTQRQIRWDVRGWKAHGTPDGFNDEWIVDLKVTDPNPDKFPRHARNMLWHAQLAWYRDGLKRASKPKPGAAYIVAADPNPPHPVVIYKLTPELLAEGDSIWQRCLDRLEICHMDNQWPGYASGVVPFDVWRSLDDINEDLFQPDMED